MLYIPHNIHGTDQGFKRLRPEGLTKFAVTNSDYRAFDIYDAYDFSKEIKNSGVSRSKLWYQAKEDRTKFYSTYSAPFFSEEIFNLHLSALNTTYIDSYLVLFHAMNYSIMKNPDYSLSKVIVKRWFEIEELYRKGKVDYIGFEDLYAHWMMQGSYDIKYLKEVYTNAKIKPTILHAGDFSPEILRYCLENAMIFQYFGISGAIKAPEGSVIQAIATAHNVTPKQVFMKLLVELGIQPLTGCNSEKYLSENANLNVELSSKEIKELIASGVFSDKSFNEKLVHPFHFDNNLVNSLQEKNSKQMLEIYEGLQNGTLVKLNDIVTRLLNCTHEQLIDELKNLAHYIPKLTPTTLSNIIVNRSPDAIDYLKEFGADFTEITSKSYEKIINAHGFDFIYVLQEKLNVQAEKLLLASLSTEDISYFNKLFNSADLNKIISYDVISIVKIHPETLSAFKSANIDPEILLMAAAAINDKNTFDDVISRCDINKLYGNDITEIILKFGIQVIKQLSSYHFKRVAITDLDKIKDHLGVEVIQELIDCAPDLIVSFIKLALYSNDRQLFSTVLESKHKFLEIDPKQLKDVILNIFEANKLEWLQEVIKSGMPPIKLEEHYIAYLIMSVINKDEYRWLQALKEAVFDSSDLADLASYNKQEIINTVIDKGKFEFLIEIKKLGIDLSVLDSYDKEKIINKVIDNGKFELLIEMKKLGIDLSVSDLYTVSSLLESVFKKGKPELLEVISEAGIITFNELKPSAIVEMVHNVFEMKQFEWIVSAINVNLDFTKAKEKDQLFVEQLKKCNSDEKCYSDCFSEEESITHYNPECVSDFMFYDEL